VTPSRLAHAASRLLIKAALSVSLLILALLVLGVIAGVAGVIGSPLVWLVLVPIWFLLRREDRLRRARR
jgi:uncharacterized oligopeptide transporter (OPT) family protein